jgi:cysteinyl-tRNA synthetase
MTRQKEPFKARKDKKIKIFTCGPSVYQQAHIGNYRTYLFEDILVRYLEHLGYKVERVLNFMDVEDKAVEEAHVKDEDIKSLTTKVIEKFNEEINLLRIRNPTYTPRASDNVDQAVKLIKELLKKDIAYWHGGDVFYDPQKFDGFGKLYGLDMNLWPKKKKRFKKDTYPGSRWNLGDFILWHGCTEGESVCFDDQLGSGRPSWNVQDPAMATKYLGFQIDICCGGIDNLYRHHDYNIAVVEGVSGETFAKYWLHSAHLFVYGQKMSKSIGNIIYLDDIFKDGFKPEHIRFFLIYHKHYREKLNFTRQQFQKVVKRLEEFNEYVSEAIDCSTCGNIRKVEPLVKELIFGLVPSFNECMNNDLDVRCAFDDLFETLNKLLAYKRDGKIGKKDCKALAKGLKEIDSVLQIIYE